MNELIDTLSYNQCSQVLMDDQCFFNNGNCGENYLCFTQYNGVQCQCKQGFELDQDRQCVDIDECEAGLVSCSGDQVCQNSAGSWGCIDLLGYRPMHDDMPCPDQCAQGCTNNDAQSFFESGSPMSISFMGFGRSLSSSSTTGCSCRSGFVLDQNGYDCIDVDECDTSDHGCTGDCLNLDGSYLCLCPSGQQLGQDGKTCMVQHQCYTCENISDPGSCNQLETCPTGVRSCETRVTKVDGQIISVSKGCKEQEKCVNANHNPTNFWTPSLCETNGNEEECSCCCQNDKCNSPADCSVANAPYDLCADEDKPSLGQRISVS